MNYRNFVLSLTLLVTLLLPYAAPVYALQVAGNNLSWDQTDWSGGAATGTVLSTVTSYESTVGLDTTSNVATDNIMLLAPAGWWDQNWSFRKTITFDNSDQLSNLIDFPVMIKLDANRIDYTKTQDQGEDIRFIDADGITQLDYAIEKWDEAGTSVVWVRVPQIDASSTTDSITMYYGNANAVDAQAYASVWDSRFEGVWHLSEPSAYTGLTDVTSNAHVLNKFAQDEPAVASGQIADGESFDGVDDHMYTTDPGFAPSAFTASFWVKANSISAANDGILGEVDAASATQGWGFFFDSNGFINFFVEGTDNVINDTSITPTNWNHIVGTWDGTTISLYVNGALVNMFTYGGSLTNAGQFEVGRLGGDTQNLDGLLDEVRISDTARSADWINADYLNMSDVFSSFGTQENAFSGSGTLVSNVFDTQLPGGTYWDSFYVSTNGVGTVDFKVRSSDMSDMSTAPLFSACTPLATGASLSTGGCVTDGDQYLQYEVTLTADANNLTPVVSNISISYSDAPIPVYSMVPTNTTPVDLSSNISVNPTIDFSINIPPNLDDFILSTDWEVDNNSDFSSPEWVRSFVGTETSTVVDSTNGTFANTLFGNTQLAYSTTYYWHARYVFSAAGTQSYSPATSFTVIANPANGGGTVITGTSGNGGGGGGGGGGGTSFGSPTPIAPGATPANPLGGFKVLIDSDSSSTNTNSVSLSLFGGPDTTKFSVSNTIDFSNSSIETYKGLASWNLCTGISQDMCGAGDKTVFVKYFNDAGNSSEVVTDTIKYQPTIVPEQKVEGVKIINTETKEEKVLPKEDEKIVEIFKRNLQIGMRGPDVKILQKFLNDQGFVIAKTGPGSPGNETELFGQLTGASLGKFKAKYSVEILKPLTTILAKTPVKLNEGFFGALTRKFVNKLLAKQTT